MLLTLHKVIAVTGRDLIRRYLFLAFLMTIAALLEAVGIGIILPFLAAMSQPDMFLGNEKVRLALAYFGAPADARSLVVLAGSAMIAVFSVKGLLVLFSTWLQGKVLHEQRAALSRKLFAHYLHLPYDMHLRKNMAHILHVIAGVTANFSTVFMAAVMLLCSELLVCATIIAMLLLVNPSATGVAVLFMLLVGSGYMRWGKSRLSRIGREQHLATLGLNKSVMEGLGSLKETRILGAEKFFLRLFDRLAQTYMHFSVRLHVLNQAPRLIAETLFVIAVVGTVIAMSLSGRDLKADLPTMALFGMAFVRLLPSFNRILSAYNNMRVSAVSLNVLFEELDEARKMQADPPVADPAPRRLNGPRFGSELILKDVCYSYPGESTPTLDGLTLKIRKGEIVGLVGRSGAGKTTLADVILGLLRPQSGDVLADGASILDKPHAWRDVVGYIPQSIYLLDDTIRRNIAFAEEDGSVDEGKLQDALTAAQLEEFIAALPRGLDTVVGDRGVRLSGGQRQRIGIARALYRDPEFLVLDEATSALDGETEGAVNEAIRRLARSKTILIIAHRLSTVSNCDRLFLIEAGKVADSGTYAELLERNAWFRRINDIIE